LNSLHRNRKGVPRVLQRRFVDAVRHSIAVGSRRASVLGQSVVVATLAFVTAAHAATNVVLYTYDAAGNIVAMQRSDPVAIAVFGFTPASGAVGTTVTVSGTGFSATATANAVNFGGVPATVTAASAATLTVSVPVGAASGRIVVTVGGNAATSAQDFVVVTPGAPTIAGFSPMAGPAGTLVTVTGTNFNPATGATTAKLNQGSAVTSQVTATQLALTVPASTGSGRIRVTTSAGNAVSAADFVVPPGAIAAADIVAVARLAADGPAQSLGLFATAKYAALLFDGNASDWLSLQFSSFVVNPASGTIAYTIYKPDNTALATGTLSATSLSIHVPQLPATGTYAVLLGTGIAQVSLDARLETNRMLPADGTTVAFARTAGQTTRALFAAVAGDQKALMVSGMTTLPAGVSLDYTIGLPNGAIFRRGTAFGLGTTSMLPPFTVTGTHALTFAPTAATTQTAFQIGLLAGVALPADDLLVDVGIVNPGEGARLNIAGIAGENLGLGIKRPVLNPASATYANFAVYKPDATLLAAGRCYIDETECAANLTNLPVTGNYGVIVQPVDGATGTLRVWLSHDVTGALVSGVPFPVALTRPGQNVRLTFAGAAGTAPALQVRGVTTVPTAGQGVLVLVNAPDGSPLTLMHLTGSGETLVLPRLPVTGTYTVFLEPESAAKGSSRVQMEVLLDAGQNLGVDGPTIASTIVVAGGSARYTFAASVGQSLGLGISALALTAASEATVTIYSPDGSPLTAVGCTVAAGSCGVNLTSLSVAGTYGIVVRPANGGTGSFGATLSTDLPGTLAVGIPLSVNLTRPGSNARLTFAGTAGQKLRLNWSAVAITGTAVTATVSVRDPTGATPVAPQLTSGVAGGYDLPALPATGTYTLFVDPAQGATMSATLTLSAR